MTDAEVQRYRAELAADLAAKQAWVDEHWGRPLPSGIGVLSERDYPALQSWIESPEYERWMRGGK